MKKYFLSLLAMMMVATVSVCVVSCGDDDDDKDGIIPNPVSLVGTWKYTFSSGYCYLSFYDDGAVSYREYDHRGVEEDGETMTYTYKGGVLSFYSKGKTKPETAAVISLTATTLVLKDWPDKGNCTFYKQ